jgi:hypothetical protein
MYGIKNSLDFWTNGIVRRLYRPTLLPQKSRKENHHIMFPFKENFHWRFIKNKRDSNTRPIRCNNGLYYSI